MQITIAQHAGFCFGVERAMDKVVQYADNSVEKVYTYGPLIHNKEALKKLRQKGVYVNENIDELSGTVFIRAHGVPPDVCLALDAKGIKYVDCTCPFVKKIHKIVEEAKDEYDICIIGDKNHPEVIGINGFAGGNSVIIKNVEEAQNLGDKAYKFFVVVQTTFNYETFEQIKEVIIKKFPSAVINNTICMETDRRQKSAAKLAQICDVMLVIGDRLSSNSRKLYEICQNNCKRTLFLETILDLQLNIFENNDRIGITAGASTLPETLKEVAQFMSEIEKNTELQETTDETESFADMLDGSLVSLHTGDVVKGTVISVNNEEVSVNLGYKSDGIIEKSEYSSDPNVLPSNELNPGDEIEVFVLRVNDGDGNVLLSKKRLESQKNIEYIEKAFENGDVIDAKVIEVVKAGLIALFKGIRVFIPYSQVSNRYVEDISVYKGSVLSIKILEMDRAKRRIVGGRRELAKQEEEKKRTEVFEKLEAGQKVEGTVSRIVTFGAFVDLGGVDGLIHISEMSWGAIKNPKDVLQEGQNVTVYVLDVNKEKGKIGLSLKDINEDPWRNVEEKYQVGDIVEGKVARLAPFGAFIELEDGVDGLVHISQIAVKHVEKCEDELQQGDIIKVKIIEVNAEKRKISLSKREVDSPSQGGQRSKSKAHENTEEVIADDVSSDEAADSVAEEMADDVKVLSEAASDAESNLDNETAT